MGKLSEFFNEVTNDGRIFSFEDVANIPQEEGGFYQKALDYQYGKIGFPKDKELQNSSDVVYVRAYTRDDGTEVRAHYRSKNGHLYADSSKRTMTSPKEEKARIEKLAQRILDEEQVISGNSEDKTSKIYELTQKDWVKRKQLDFPNDPILSRFPLSAREYYQIALTNGDSIDTIDKANTKGFVRELKDGNLKKHVLNIKGVKEDSMVVVPKQGSIVIDKIKKSKEFKDTISNLIKKETMDKGGSIEKEEICYSSRNPFSISGDLRLTFANAHLYNTHYDKDGNLRTIFVDWYDFTKQTPLSWVNGINNNAYEQQEQGLLTNYVILVPITIPKEEIKWYK